MAKSIRMMLAVIVFAIYYVVFCWMFGFDLGDPWTRLRKWAKGDKGDRPCSGAKRRSL